MAEILLTTLVKRPYVAAFLVAYACIAVRSLGLRFTAGNLLAGYALAFFSEWLSINHGVPYGWYRYVYENLAGEWLNRGVPVWDSASYVFMNFAGLSAARIALRKVRLDSPRKCFGLVALAAFLVTLLDVVVDPVAHLGERWFLGRIYYYPEPGLYFDVTLANFAGWYVTSLAINGFAVFALGFERSQRLTAPENAMNRFLTLGLYYGIFAFGTAIAVYLGEWILVLCDAFWIALTAALIRGKAKAACPGNSRPAI